MSLKQIMADDLDIFYDVNDFATSAKFNSADITINELDDIEISSSDHKIISAKTSDVFGLKTGDIFTIDSIDYKVSNFDFKDSYKLEFLIAITEV